MREMCVICKKKVPFHDLKIVVTQDENIIWICDNCIVKEEYIII